MDKTARLTLSDLSGYFTSEPDIYSVPEYYLQVVNNDFYYLQDIQSDVYAPQIHGGVKDAVYLLYSNESLNAYPSNSTDYYNITSTSAYSSQPDKINFT